MIKKAHLALSGRQRDGASAESVTEVCAEADYSEKDGRHYILYEEIPEGTEPPVKSTVIIRDGLLEIRRSGAVRSHMVFESGKTHIADYVTPYGTLQLEIFTNVLDVSASDTGIEALLEYTLASGGQPLSDCTLTLSLRFL